MGSTKIEKESIKWICDYSVVSLFVFTCTQLCTVFGKNWKSLKRRVMVFDNNFIFRRWISSELCF